jgi:hypothetical protein
MTTIQAVLFGVMLAWTPSLFLLAVLLWREGIGSNIDLEFDDQPPYPKPSSRVQPPIDMTTAAKKGHFNHRSA